MLYKVFVIDDEPIIREGLKQLVDWNALGFEITAEAENGVQALEMFEHTACDVLLTDIRLPVMSGLELLRRMKKANIHCKKLVFSAYADFEYARNAVEYGALKYFLKPVNENELEDTLADIKNMLDLERQTAANFCRGIHAVPEFIKTIAHEVAEENYIAIIEKIHACRDISQILALLNSLCCPSRPAQSSQPFDTISTVKKYARENCCSDINITTIADVFGYNPGYLARLFHQKEGIGIKDFLLACRIQEACVLLLDGRMKIADIAEHSGFKDINRFFAAFKLLKGCTPNNYKKQLGGFRQA